MVIGWGFGFSLVFEVLRSSLGLLKHNGLIDLLDLVVQAPRAVVSVMLGLSFMLLCFLKGFCDICKPLLNIRAVLELGPRAFCKPSTKHVGTYSFHIGIVATMDFLFFSIH